MNRSALECQFPDCGLPHRARGYCDAHYRQLRKGKALAPLYRKDPDARCSFEGCDRPVRALGLCSGHHQQQWAGKQLTPVRRIYYDTEDGFWARTQITPDCWLWGGAPNASGYGVMSINHKKQLAHRYAYELLVDPLSPDEELDHRCRNRLCVNPAHLRVATRKQNMENAVRIATVSGMRGVSKHENRWRARVTHHGVEHYLGRFDTAEDAAEAARLKRLELFTHSDGR